MTEATWFNVANQEHYNGRRRTTLTDAKEAELFDVIERIEMAVQLCKMSKQRRRRRSYHHQPLSEGNEDGRGVVDFRGAPVPSETPRQRQFLWP